MLSVSACWFNFRTRKRRCKSCRVINVQIEVYTLRVLEKVGYVVCQKSLGRPSLSRRDVDLPRRDVKITLQCHVATWIYTSRRQNHTSLSCRDVGFHVATSMLKPSVTSRRGMSRRDVIFQCLCHVATWDSNVATWEKSTLCHVATLHLTSRRRLVNLSVTSRRDPAHRDVALFLAQEWFILALHLTHPHSSEP